MENEMNSSSTLTSNNEFNPLKEQVEHKPQKQRQVDPTLLTQDIPEPKINLSSVQNEEDIFSESTTGKKPNLSSPNGQAKPQNTFNPGLNDLPPSQKEQAADNFAGLLWGGYQKLHDLGNNLLKISDGKIVKWQTSGEVDLTVPVPYTNTDWLPMAEFIQEFNEQAGKTFSISQEFKDEVNPVLVRVLQKYGHGLTDEQFLVSMFAQDMIFKVAKGYQMKAVTNSIIQFAMEQTKNARMGTESTDSKTSPSASTSQYQEVSSSPNNPGNLHTANTPATPATDAQSNAIAELVVSPSQGSVQQAVPVFGSEEHLTRSKEISDRARTKTKETKGKRGRKPNSKKGNQSDE